MEFNSFELVNSLDFVDQVIKMHDGGKIKAFI